jgi:hypothetical protein
MSQVTQKTLETTPAVVALEETYDATISGSTELSLNASTNLIEVCAIDKAIMMKWGTSDASTSDFDEVIPANTVRQFSVPIDSATGVKYTAVNFIEQSATAILAVVEKAV